MTLGMIDIKSLFAKGERQHLDAKSSCAFEGDTRLELTKDIIAMANTRDGGTLVIGVSEDRDTGTLSFDGLTPDQIRSFDITKIHDFVKERATPPVKFSVQTSEHNGDTFIVIQVPEFDDQPHVCTKDAQTATNKTIFRRSDILVRTPGAASERISDDNTMRQFLNLAIQRRSDAILSDISRLLRGGRIPISTEPFWMIAQKLADTAWSMPADVKDAGTWTFILRPDTPLVLAGDKPVYEILKDALFAAQVSLRGWNFPHAVINEILNRKDAASGLSYIEMETNWHNCIESLALFENGYVQYRRILREDLTDRSSFDMGSEKPGTLFNWLGAVYDIGESFLFATRYYSELKHDGAISYEIQLTNMKGRQLRAWNVRRELNSAKVSAEPVIVARGTVDATLLRSDVSTTAIDSILQIFTLFHWTDAHLPAMLREDLSKLFTRRL